RHEEVGHRPVRTERGLCLGGAALHSGLRHRSFEDQRQWRRDRARPSARRDGGDDPRYRARRVGAHQQVHRVGDLVHRRRHGKGEEAANQMLFEQSRRFSLVLRGIETCGKPWAAAINGLALGGGFEVTLSCHYRVAAENPKTRLGLPEVKVGLFPGAGGTQRVPRLVPPQDAMTILLKGDPVTIEKAKALNLIHAIVPAADLIKAAKDWIKAGGKAVAPWDEKGFKLPGG